MIRRIGICSPSTPFGREHAERVIALAAEHAPSLELFFSDQCFAVEGHFAGPDALRRDTFVEMANDPAYEAIWFCRGGYGAARMAPEAITRLNGVAAKKRYLGYSDAGVLLAGLYRHRIGHPAHGPMPTDIRREGGEAAILRALDWLAESAQTSLEPTIGADVPVVAFNLITLSMIIGTGLMPNLSGHILMVEELGEYDYAFDRAMFHVTSALSDAGLAGLRLGRVSEVQENDRAFLHDHEAIARHWCAQAGIDYLGRADIGHDVANCIVPFGKLAS